jgi:hypothetical protein
MAQEAAKKAAEALQMMTRQSLRRLVIISRGVERSVLLAAVAAWRRISVIAFKANHALARAQAETEAEKLAAERTQAQIQTQARARVNAQERLKAEARAVAQEQGRVLEQARVEATMEAKMEAHQAEQARMEDDMKAEREVQRAEKARMKADMEAEIEVQQAERHKSAEKAARERRNAKAVEAALCAANGELRTGYASLQQQLQQLQQLQQQKDEQVPLSQSLPQPVPVQPQLSLPAEPLVYGATWPTPGPVTAMVPRVDRELESRRLGQELAELQHTGALLEHCDDGLSARMLEHRVEKVVLEQRAVQAMLKGSGGGGGGGGGSSSGSSRVNGAAANEGRLRSGSSVQHLDRGKHDRSRSPTKSSLAKQSPLTPQSTQELQLLRRKVHQLEGKSSSATQRVSELETRNAMLYAEVREKGRRVASSEATPRVPRHLRTVM